MRSWINFWNSTNSIYVNEKHKVAHSNKVLKDIKSWLPNNDCIVLDFGCGEAIYAPELSKKCKHLILVDASENVCKNLRSKHSQCKSISILDISEFYKLDDGRIDLVIVNSVFQYLSAKQTKDILNSFYRILKKNGKLIIADIIPENHPIFADIFGLLIFSLKNGFFFFALLGLFKTFFSNYRSLRNKLGLSFYSSKDFLELLSKSRFKGKIEPLNFGHNQKRLCFSAKKNITRSK